MASYQIVTDVVVLVADDGVARELIQKHKPEGAVIRHELVFWELELVVGRVLCAKGYDLLLVSFGIGRGESIVVAQRIGSQAMSGL